MKQVFSKFGKYGIATLLAGACAVAASGQAQQPQEEPSSVDTFAIPDNITILGDNDLGERRATAIVNGTIITSSDVEQRVALVLASNDAQQIPEEELKRLRLQVLRNLIDETLQIQEAKAQEMEVTQEEVNEVYGRVAQDRFNGSVEQLDTYLRSVGSSPICTRSVRPPSHSSGRSKASRRGSGCCGATSPRSSTSRARK